MCLRYCAYKICYGHYDEAYRTFRLTVQLTNMKIRLLPPRFRTIGPWPHNPHSASALGKRKRDDTDDGDIEIF